MIQLPPPLEYGAMAVYPYSEALREKFCTVSNFGDPIELGFRVGDFYHVPRQMAPKGGVITLSDGYPTAYSLALPPKNEEQARVCRESEALLKSGQDHIICAGTGFGKTYVGSYLTGAMGTTTLVVVTKEDLMQQWPKRLKTFLGLSDSDIGIIQQDKCVVEGKKVVVAMVHSLAKDKYPAFIKDYFGMVIFDEVHRMGADTFSTAARMFSATHRVGLSATPRRRDGKDIVFRANIGEVMVRAESVPMVPKVIVVRSPYRVPIVRWKVDGRYEFIPMPHDFGKLSGLLSHMAKDKARNALILGFVKAAYHKGRNIVVFSELKEKHLIPLQKQLVKEYGVPEEDTGFYVGGMSEAAKEKAISKPVVFATYQMCSEATDVPWWDVAALASPRADVQQTIGRVLREYPDKPTPIVWDLADTSSEVLAAYYGKRRNLYMSMGSEIIIK